MERPVLLPLVYGGTALYYAILLQAPSFRLEQHEHFEKQTWRNRIRILSANGPLDLIVPLERKGRTHRPMKEQRIAYDHPWPSLHWRSITSAYRSAPYFEFFEDRFRPLYEKRFRYLLDLNLAILEATLALLRSSMELPLTERYEGTPADHLDLRGVPPALPEEKKRAGAREPIDVTGPYPQVFDERFGYVPGLSVLDLLFNEGPGAADRLRSVDPTPFLPEPASL